MPDTDPKSRYISVDDFALLAGVKTKTIYAWAQRGLVAHVAFGRTVRFLRKDVNDFIRKSRVPARPAG